MTSAGNEVVKGLEEPVLVPVETAMEVDQEVVGDENENPCVNVTSEKPEVRQKFCSIEIFHRAFYNKDKVHVGTRKCFFLRLFVFFK